MNCRLKGKTRRSAEIHWIAERRKGRKIRKKSCADHKRHHGDLVERDVAECGGPSGAKLSIGSIWIELRYGIWCRCLMHEYLSSFTEEDLWKPSGRGLKKCTIRYGYKCGTELKRKSTKKGKDIKKMMDLLNYETTTRTFAVTMFNLPTRLAYSAAIAVRAQVPSMSASEEGTRVLVQNLVDDSVRDRPL
uniref:Uncharacterized protein n=1 Tax=Angiostrongylus cantonensis TaxID=6313 RepID=A0A158PCW8_ANGCA